MPMLVNQCQFVQGMPNKGQVYLGSRPALNNANALSHTSMFGVADDGSQIKSDDPKGSAITDHQAALVQAHMLDPSNVDVICCLAKIYGMQGQHEASIEWYRAGLRLRSMDENINRGLASAMVNRGMQIKPQDPKAARELFQEALVHNPCDAYAHHNLGVVYAEKGKWQKALIHYNLTINFNPQCAEAHSNIGEIYKQRGEIDRAIFCFQRAIQCNPTFAQALNNMGAACTAVGRLDEALEYLTRAATIAPNYADVFNNFGVFFWDQGSIVQALSMYERAIVLAPGMKHPSQNRLLLLNYVPDLNTESIYKAHRTWADCFCREQGPAYTEWLVTRVPDKRLRIGYISGDFFLHSVSYFAHALLEYYDRDQFDVYIYSNTTREDEKTVLFQQLVDKDKWHNIVGKTGPEVAAMIHGASIDILIDLAGHTSNNRLDVMVLKPAPVQFTYIGYNNTTGLGAIDYRITDEIVDPTISAQPFSEELIRFPKCFLCYTPPSTIPGVGPLPAFHNGYITFGSFSCLAKVNSQCVALWAKILHEVPNSVLVIKAKGFYSNEMKTRFYKHFETHGTQQHRLKFIPLSPTNYEHLSLYNAIDIALDTFPYSNTTTTCEALFMGTPTITLAGDSHGSRTGVTLCKVLGLSELVVSTQEEYVEKAKALAGDLQKLSALRQSLRNTMLSSPLCDGPGFVKKSFEPVLREKWERFCEGRPPSVQAAPLPDNADPGVWFSNVFPAQNVIRAAALSALSANSGYTATGVASHTQPNSKHPVSRTPHTPFQSQPMDPAGNTSFSIPTVAAPSHAQFSQGTASSQQWSRATA